MAALRAQLLATRGLQFAHFFPKEEAGSSSPLAGVDPVFYLTAVQLSGNAVSSAELVQAVHEVRGGRRVRGACAVAAHGRVAALLCAGAGDAHPACG